MKRILALVFIAVMLSSCVVYADTHSKVINYYEDDGSGNAVVQKSITYNFDTGSGGLGDIVLSNTGGSTEVRKNGSVVTTLGGLSPSWSAVYAAIGGTAQTVNTSNPKNITLSNSNTLRSLTVQSGITLTQTDGQVLGIVATGNIAINGAIEPGYASVSRPDSGNSGRSGADIILIAGGKITGSGILRGRDGEAGSVTTAALCKGGDASSMWLYAEEMDIPSINLGKGGDGGNHRSYNNLPGWNSSGGSNGTITIYTGKYSSSVTNPKGIAASGLVRGNSSDTFNTKSGVRPTSIYLNAQYSVGGVVEIESLHENYYYSAAYSSWNVQGLVQAIVESGDIEARVNNRTTVIPHLNTSSGHNTASFVKGSSLTVKVTGVNEGSNTFNISGNTIELLTASKDVSIKANTLIAGESLDVDTASMFSTTLKSGSKSTSALKLGYGTNDYGINTFKLTEFVSYYSGAYPSADFKLFKRNIGTSGVWKEIYSGNVALSGTPELKDLDTEKGVATDYYVAFKPYGTSYWIHYLPAIATVTSIGPATIDEVPPILSYSTIAKGLSTISTNSVEIVVLATDNRTTENELTMQIKVNEKYYTYDSVNGLYTDGSETSWGPYVTFSSNLPIQEGQNKVTIRIRDKAGNIASTMHTVTCLTGGIGSLAPNLPGETINSALTVTVPLGGSASKETINGQEAYVVSSNVVQLGFDTSKLPANIRGVTYSISGDNYSRELSIGEGITVQLPPLSGLHLLKIMFVTTEGYNSTKASPVYIAFDKEVPAVSARPMNDATITKDSAVPVALTIRDDISQNFTWSTNLTSWSAVPVDGQIDLPVSLGRNAVTIYVKDSSGKTGSCRLSIWRVN